MLDDSGGELGAAEACSEVQVEFKIEAKAARGLSGRDMALDTAGCTYH